MNINKTCYCQIVINDVIFFTSARNNHVDPSAESGTVYGFGDNSDGQLGKTADILYSDVPVEITKFDQQIVRIATGSYHTAVLIGCVFQHDIVHFIYFFFSENRNHCAL